MATPLTPLEGRLDATRLREHAPKVSIWEPPSVAAARAAPAEIPIEAALIATIEQPLRAGETHRTGGDRKERELAKLIDTLTPVQSLALGTRLANARQGDPLVAAVERLVVDRRVRLRAYLERRRRGGR